MNTIPQDLDVVVRISLEDRLEQISESEPVKSALSAFFASLNALGNEGVSFAARCESEFRGVDLMMVALEVAWKDGKKCASAPMRRMQVVE